MLKFATVDPEEIEYKAKCSCGAVSVTIEGKQYSMRPSTYQKIFQQSPPKRIQWCNCDHCVNHWGVDLCACGSGESFNKCHEGFEGFCGNPMQVIGSHTHVCAGDAWI